MEAAVVTQTNVDAATAADKLGEDFYKVILEEEPFKSTTVRSILKSYRWAPFLPLDGCRGRDWFDFISALISEAPNLYWLCIVFLTISCIGYAMPFILCATICCCFPCIISVMGFREDLTENRGATPESINSLPTYKFKMKKTRNGNGREINSGAGEGGVVAAGTEKERVISGEDATQGTCGILQDERVINTFSFFNFVFPHWTATVLIPQLILFLSL